MSLFIIIMCMVLCNLAAYYYYASLYLHSISQKQEETGTAGSAKENIKGSLAGTSYHRILSSTFLSHLSS